MKKVKKVLRQTWVRVRLYRVRFLRWWRKLDRMYTWRWRAANLFAVALVLSGVIIPIAQELWQSSRYTLSAEALQLTGHTDPSLAKQLTYDSSKQLYQFNKDAVASGDKAGVPAELQKASVGAGDKSNAKTYSLDIPKDFTEGVTYHDTNSQLSFKLVPNFKALPGKTDQGHLVFPLSGDNQAVYTLKNNGLKEDIIVPKVTQSEMRFDYTLDLPKTMVAKAIPESGGAIGIYSADPSLFGDITYGSDKDRAAVEKARENADKTYLVFGLPAPVVKDTDGKEAGSARFEMEGTRLSVIAEQLKASDGPITIDPSVVVTSTSDFQTGGNNEGMIDFGTSGQITRGELTGGSASVGWTATTSFTGVRRYFGSAAYNGYLYVLGGTTGTGLSDTQYAPINTDGTVGSWTATTSLPSACNGMQMAVYNGYMYVLGGNCSSLTNAVQYAPINSNGTLGSWNTTTGFTTARDQFGVAVYNGYFYVFGGNDGTNNLSDTQYASINADGTVGSWTATTSLTFARRQFGYTAYGGYLYILGGFTNTRINTVQYAILNSNGTVGSWQTATSLTDNRTLLRAAVYNGYIYVFGGTVGGVPVNTVQYAPINTNGSIGSWQTTTSFTDARSAHEATAYKGYLYVLGGLDNTPANLNDVQYAKIDRSGQPTSFGTLTNNFTTARANACAVAYNGYLYAIGGSTNDSSGNNVTTVQYTALNSSTGNNGSWSSTTVLPTARGSAGCTAHNGYLYVLGGYTGAGGSGTASSAVLYNTINSDGTLSATWTTSGNSLPVAYPARPAVLTYGTSGGTYLYVLGGCSSVGDASCDDTNYAALNASTGAVGTWTTSGNAMVNQYVGRAYAQIGQYLYAFGGLQSGGTAVSAAEYTSINNNGSINAWSSTTSMGTAIRYTDGASVNGCIYSLGGENSSGTPQSTVQYACPAANGTISAWYSGPSLSVATAELGTVSYNGYLYGVGGNTGGGVVATTQFAYVNNGGSGANSAWSTGANNLSSGTFLNAVTAYNGYIYSVGGNTGNNTVRNTVSYSQLAASGDYGAFSTDANAFTTGRDFNGAVAYNGYLYVIGGENDGGSAWYGDVQYAPIGSSGGLSGAFASTTSFVTGTGSDTGRSGACTVAYKGYMYALGGYDGSSNHADTRYAAINSNGTLGSWADSGNNFTNGRFGQGCFAANGYMYMVGGRGASVYNDVQVAPINSNGTLGSWSYTSSFATPRYVSVVGYSNGFVYMAGGCSSGCSSIYGDTQYAPVYPNGTLGAWQQSTTTMVGAGDGTAYGSGVVYNGSMYIVGGFAGGGGGVMLQTNYAPVNVISRTARYSKLVDLGNPVSVSSITYNGTLNNGITPGVAPISFRAAGNDGVFGSYTSASAITAGSTACLATSQNYKRYLLVTITVDDTNSAILADANGTLGNVTDFTVNYITPHPAPNIRLRHGQTLQTGNLSPLDTCFDSLIAAYGLNEGSGSTSTPNRGSQILTLGPSVSWTAGHSGGSALTSSGGGSLGAYTPWNNIDMTNATIMAWCKPTDLTGGTIRPLFGVSAGNDAPADNSEFLIWAQRSDFGAPNVLQGNIRVNGSLKELDGPALTANQWVHLALSYDGANIRIYVNGSLYDTVAASGTADIGNFSFNVLSGANDAYGVVDDVQVYSSALSAADITKAMNTSVP